MLLNFVIITSVLKLFLKLKHNKITNTYHPKLLNQQSNIVKLINIKPSYKFVGLFTQPSAPLQIEMPIEH